MKLSLLQENFSTALENTSRFVSARAQLPILSNILLATDNGQLKLTATNLELGISCWIGAKIEQEGSMTIPAKEITEFVSYLSAGRLDLELDSKNLFTITSSKAQSTFTTTPPDDFPNLPPINPDQAIDLDMSLLRDSVNQIAFSAATDDTRPILTAVLCSFTSNSLTLVATDGFRLSLKEIKLVNPISLPTDQMTLLIPGKSLSEVVKLAKNDKKLTLGLSNDEHQLVFVLDGLELVSRLIEGDYPEYRRIIPSAFSTRLLINKEELSQAVKIASVFARESANVIRLNIKDSHIEISANAPQIGQNKATVEAKVEGGSLDIAFNYKFISDFLSVCKGEELTLELNEPLTPALFRDQSDPQFTHIIMPVRLQD
ncbi:MAG: DNA polymerase III subunit beta [Patescibacteria group bacterium]|jgi:DNA polymerase-3 subunit beta